MSENMTMTKVREAAKKRIRFCKMSGLDELVPFNKEMLRVVEQLWKEGYVKEFGNDVLVEADCYKINSQDSEFSVIACLDMRVISATKESAKRFGAYLFNM